MNLLICIVSRLYEWYRDSLVDSPSMPLLLLFLYSRCPAHSAEAEDYERSWWQTSEDNCNNCCMWLHNIRYVSPTRWEWTSCCSAQEEPHPRWCWECHRGHPPEMADKWCTYSFISTLDRVSQTVWTGCTCWAHSCNSCTRLVYRVCFHVQYNHHNLYFLSGISRGQQETASYYASYLQNLYTSMSHSHTPQRWTHVPRIEFVQLAMIGCVGQRRGDREEEMIRLAQQGSIEIILDHKAPINFDSLFLTATSCTTTTTTSSKSNTHRRSPRRRKEHTCSIYLLPMGTICFSFTQIWYCSSCLLARSIHSECY